MRHTVTILGLLAPALAACALEDFDQDGVSRSDDCNDADPTQGLPVSLHVDGDGDGYGGPTMALGCPGNPWLVTNDLDCNDDDRTVHPDAGETGCDGRDNDCDPSTVDGPAISGVGRTWPSVQQAVDDTAFGGLVTLCASQILEHFTVPEALVLRGAGAERTVIDAGGTDTAIRVADGTILEGLTVTGGHGTTGGGIQVIPGSSEPLRLIDVTVRGNQADEGGGIWASNVDMVLENVTMSDNVATRGGGLFAHVDPGLEVRFDGVTVTGNVAEEGGGVWLQGSLRADDTTMEGNRATVGGGLWLDGFAASAKGSLALSENSAVEGGGAAAAGSLSGLVIERNTANVGGGVVTTGTLALDDVTLLENLALSGDGGGMLARHATTMVGGALSSNEAVGRGGGLAAHGTLTLRNTDVIENRADIGGALALDGFARISLSRFIDNVAHERGGALYTACSSDRVVITGSLLETNRAANGAAAWLGGGHLQLTDAVVSKNAASEGGSGAIEAARAACDPSLVDVGAGVAWSDNEPYDLGLAGQGYEAPDQPFTCEVATDAASCQASP